MSIANVNTKLERSGVGLGLRKVAQIIDYSDFTDNADTTGSLTMTDQLPAGAIMLATKITVKTGFTGDTTAVIKVGKSDTEDEFSDGASINILAAGMVGDSVEDPLEILVAAASVYLTITSNAAFASVSAGRMLVEVFYLSTEVEITADYPLESLL